MLPSITHFITAHKALNSMYTYEPTILGASTLDKLCSNDQLCIHEEKSLWSNSKLDIP